VTVTIDYLLNRKSHLAEVAKWQHNQFGYLNPSTTIEQRASKLSEALQLERLPVSLVAISSDGQLLGSANVLATTLTHQHLTPWLSSVYVPLEHRGKGIASALSLRAAEEAARLNFNKIYLFTPHSENLYARLGWQTFDRKVHNGVSLTMMQKAV
jgi:predicted N-acetyltransferase YhbS